VPAQQLALGSLVSTIEKAGLQAVVDKRRINPDPATIDANASEMGGQTPDPRAIPYEPALCRPLHPREVAPAS
jgi:hypothetical protein